MNKIKTEKSKDDIKKEWDLLADLRNQQILNEIDVSYSRVIMPNLLKMHNFSDQDSILDIGCGTGMIPKYLENKFYKYVGIDFSSNMIMHAKANCGTSDKISFLAEPAQQALLRFKDTFTVAIANMVFMNMYDLEDVLALLNAALISEGKLLISITHPCFWPIYRGLNKESWFRYDKILIIESPFNISNQSSNLLSTFIHRPAQYYLSSLVEYGFKIEKIFEPYPTIDVEKKYSLKWEYPRFLFLMVTKN